MIQYSKKWFLLKLPDPLLSGIDQQSVIMPCPVLASLLQCFIICPKDQDSYEKGRSMGVLCLMCFYPPAYFKEEDILLGWVPGCCSGMVDSGVALVWSPHTFSPYPTTDPPACQIPFIQVRLLQGYHSRVVS